VSKEWLGTAASSTWRLPRVNLDKVAFKLAVWEAPVAVTPSSTGTDQFATSQDLPNTSINLWWRSYSEHFIGHIKPDLALTADVIAVR
jgi:hypothetical protein